MKVAFVRSKPIASGIKSFYFEADEPVRHVAGQFVELVVRHASPDKRGQRRWFTLSSSPTEPELAITTKFAQDNGSSFKAALDSLQPGDRVNLSQPMGDFVLPENEEKPLVFVAGGVGITPMRSMIKWLADTASKRKITLFYSCRVSSEVAFRDLFSSYDMQFHPIVKEDDASCGDETGSLTAEFMKDKMPELAQSRVYISGPPPMVSGLKKQLRKAGVSSGSIVTDYFPGYSEV